MSLTHEPTIVGDAEVSVVCAVRPDTTDLVEMHEEVGRELSSTGRDVEFLYVLPGRREALEGQISRIESSDGRVRVVYQDVSSLTLWMAERGTDGLWTTTQLEGEGLSATATEGYWVSQTSRGNSSVISAWYFDPNEDDNGVSLFWP